MNDQSASFSVFDLSGKRVFVAGHRGMVGSAIVRRLERCSCDVVTAGRQRVDLLKQDLTESFLGDLRPQVVIVAAAKVGGIYANDTFPAEFIYENLAIAANVIHGAYLAKVEKLLFLGSSCIYPRLAQQPIVEEALLSGPLSRPTNGMPLPRSRKSSCAKPTGASTGRISFQLCQRMCSGRVTITIRRMPTSSRPSFGAFTKQRSPQHQP